MGACLRCLGGGRGAARWDGIADSLEGRHDAASVLGLLLCVWCLLWWVLLCCARSGGCCLLMAVVGAVCVLSVL